MPKKTLEICVDSYESAMNAWFGGADRLELCRDLTVGGLTPSAGFVASMMKMEKPHKESPSPLWVLIRPHARDFFYNSYEVIEMEEDIKIMKQLGVTGLVFGALNKYKEVDIPICKRLLNAADGIPCTFHRAFDAIIDQKRGLEDLIELGFARVLTSGDNQYAMDGLDTLNQLVKQARGRIIVMPGGNVTDKNIEDILSSTGADEIHSSGRQRDPKFPNKKLNLCSPTVVESMKATFQHFQ